MAISTSWDSVDHEEDDYYDHSHGYGLRVVLRETAFGRRKKVSYWEEE